MGGRQGSGRRPLPVGGVHLDQRGTRCGRSSPNSVWTQAGFLRRQDRLRGRVHRRPGARLGISPELVPPVSSPRGAADEFPRVRQHFRPGEPGSAAAPTSPPRPRRGLRERGWEIEDVTAYRTVRARAAGRGDPRDDQDRRLLTPSASPPAPRCATWWASPGKPHARTIVACIGPSKTAETAAEFGLRVDVQPETAAVPLVDARWPSMRPGCAPRALPPPRKKSRRR